MKKTVICLLIAVFIICGVSQVFAVSTDEYSIDLPAEYVKGAENSYTKADGTNVDIQIEPFSGSSKGAFSNEFLDEFEKTVGEQVVIGIKDEVRAEVKKQYGSSMTDEMIEQYLNKIKFDGVEKREITTATKNNYKCAHVLSKYTIVDAPYYTDQYLFISNNKAYTLTAAIYKQSDIESQEIKDIINSFTLANYKDPEAKSNTIVKDAIKGACIGAGIAALTAIVGAVAKKKAKQNNAEEKTETNQNNENK